MLYEFLPARDFVSFLRCVAGHPRASTLQLTLEIHFGLVITRSILTLYTTDLLPYNPFKMHPQNASSDRTARSHLRPVRGFR